LIEIATKNTKFLCISLGYKLGKHIYTLTNQEIIEFGGTEDQIKLIIFWD